MVRMPLLVATLATLALAPASASADAVCTLQFDVRFDDNGRFSQDGAGSGACMGNVAGSALDPSAANPSIAGVATPGGGCAPALEKGVLQLRPRRALEMWAPEHLELTGDWRAVGGALSGTLITEATAVTITGTLAFAGDCSDTGRLHVELLLGNERPAPRTATPEPAAAERAAAPAPKAKRRTRRPCRRAKAKSRAAKRCRRAARRA